MMNAVLRERMACLPLGAMRQARPLTLPPSLLTLSRPGLPRSWELDYVHIMGVLEQLGIPLRAADRDDSHPLVGFEGGGRQL